MYRPPFPSRACRSLQVSCARPANSPRRFVSSSSTSGLARWNRSLTTPSKGSLSSPIRNIPRTSSILSLIPSSLRSYTSSTSNVRSSAATVNSTHSFSQDVPDRASPSTSTHAEDGPRLTHPSISRYLFVTASLVFGIVVVGGLTRLTESGLSITEWNLVTGTLPPLSSEAWETEFEKYRQTPEFKLMNSNIELSDFKTIFLWEYSHRLLGRIIGLSFLLPIPYFIYRRRITPRSSRLLFLIATLIGSQGLLGWYMVKSGLSPHEISKRDGVPRVSQYRLAAHLGMAFAVYAICLRSGVGIWRDWKVVEGLKKGLQGQLGGVKGWWEALDRLNRSEVRRFKAWTAALTGLVFLTAISGAFVAGLDAGLLYNTFPYMGDRIVPPKQELFSDSYVRSNRPSPKPSESVVHYLNRASAESDPNSLSYRFEKMWRNLLENPTTVQFDHRLLATTTFLSLTGLLLASLRPSLRRSLPPLTHTLVRTTFGMACVQVGLGISTLVYLVPVPLAAAHQAGSLVLLSLLVGVGASLRLPGKTARQLIEAIKRQRGGGGGIRTRSGKAQTIDV